MKAHSLLVPVVIAAMAIVLGGCGGSGGPDSANTPGSLSVTVLFPPDSSPAQEPKVIPPGTDSVVVRILEPDTGNELVPDTVIARPQGDNEARETIERVRAGSALVQALAKPTTDGSGATLAQASAPVEVPSGDTVQVGLNLFGVAATVQVTPATLDVLTTKTTQLQAVAYDAIGNIIVGAAFTWASSNTAAATVSDAGLVAAITPGDSTVTATETREGVSDSCAVTVTQRETTQLVVDPGAAFISKGQTAQISAVAYDRDGDEIVGEPIAWQSSDPGVATVNTTGLTTGISEGSATITATASNAQADTALVDVSLYVIKLAWRGNANLDLHVFGPDYVHASPDNPEIAAGKLVTQTGVPTAREFFSGRASLPGAYYIAVNYYEGTGAVEAQVTVEGIGPSPIVRTATVTRANQNTGYPVLRDTPSWFRPVDVFISTDDITTFGPDTTVPLYESDPNP